MTKTKREREQPNLEAGVKQRVTRKERTLHQESPGAACRCRSGHDEDALAHAEGGTGEAARKKPPAECLVTEGEGGIVPSQETGKAKRDQCETKIRKKERGEKLYLSEEEPKI